MLGDCFDHCLSADACERIGHVHCKHDTFWVDGLVGAYCTMQPSTAIFLQAKLFGSRCIPECLFELCGNSFAQNSANDASTTKHTKASRCFWDSNQLGCQERHQHIVGHVACD